MRFAVIKFYRLEYLLGKRFGVQIGNRKFECTYAYRTENKRLQFMYAKAVSDRAYEIVYSKDFNI